MPESTPLFMLRLDLDAQRLLHLGRRRGLPIREADFGYLAHAIMTEAFGDRCPGPFTVQQGRGRWLRVLAYSDAPAGALQEHASLYADPGVYEAFGWEALSQKPMPSEWPVGRRFGFQLRACPVIRRSADGPKGRRGAEVDAFLAACWAAGPEVPVDREDVYRGWLEKQLDRRGGARLLSACLEGFQRTRLLRRRQDTGRRGALLERPDALLEGSLEITDGATFSDLLRRGIGRHRSFGFGMLLLAPPR